MKIAFLGAGAMGRPMAGHLQKAGHELFLSPHGGKAPPELMEGGAKVCRSPAEAAANAELIILMVPDTPDVEDVLFRADGVASTLSAGQCVIDMSSIDPQATRRFAARVAEKGCDYVDAPVSGGEVGAKAASLTIMCGGSEAAFERVRPVLELMGKSITRIGSVGDGQVAKVSNQIVVALNILAVAEALTFAAKAGADPAKVREALMGGFAGSRVMEVHGERMLRRTFDPGFRIELHQKDLRLALDGARTLSMALPATAIAQQMFSVCSALGGAAWDHSALVRAIELMAGEQTAA
jgi:2-hydroxy-3-oxopropionate reductase